MRYSVGQIALYMFTEFVPKNLRFNNLYYPWEDELVKIHFKKLVCKEHHRVPGSWDDEVKYDGFIFSETVDGKETLFNNQYPRASYGQLDDSADWKIIDEHEDFVCYQDAEKVLESLLRGVKELKDKEPDWAKSIQDHYDQLLKLIDEQGFNVVVKPHEFKRKYGTVDSYPDILSATITPKETQST